MNPTSFLSVYDRLCAGVFDRLRDPMLLFVRLTWGWLFCQTGYGKLTHLAQTTDFFRELGLPFPGTNALFVGALECIGGLLLAAGLGGRVVALLLAGNMLVAYLTAHASSLLSLREFTEAAPYPYLVASLLVLAFGPGRLALDSLVRRTPVTAARTAREVAA